MSKRVVIINTGPFPEGDAGAVRLLYTAKALTLAGYTVEVLCRGKKRDAGCVDGVAYRSFRYADRSRLLRGLDYFCFPARVRAYLCRHKAEYLYIYDAQPSVFTFCKAFARKHDVKVLYDCVEWYSPEQFKEGEKSDTYRRKNRINTEIVDGSFSVIAISRYLEQYFAGKGIHTMRLPILCDTEESVQKAPSAEKLTLFYAGAPHRKDLVGNVLEAALLLTPEERARLSVVLVGVNRQSLINVSGIAENTLEACRECLTCYGRVPRDEVLRLMAQADFTILPRNAALRFAQAGFPSKAVESLSHKTPILCNLSSDLALYLTDGENAILADDHTPSALVTALKRALALTPPEKDRMKQTAWESAKQHFDYRRYAESLHEFFESM